MFQTNFCVWFWIIIFNECIDVNENQIQNIFDDTLKQALLICELLQIIFRVGKLSLDFHYC